MYHYLSSCRCISPFPLCACNTRFVFPFRALSLCLCPRQPSPSLLLLSGMVDGIAVARDLCCHWSASSTNACACFCGNAVEETFFLKGSMQTDVHTALLHLPHTPSPLLKTFSNRLAFSVPFLVLSSYPTVNSHVPTGTLFSSPRPLSACSLFSPSSSLIPSNHLPPLTSRCVCIFLP